MAVLVRAGDVPRRERADYWRQASWELFGPHRVRFIDDRPWLGDAPGPDEQLHVLSSGPVHLAEVQGHRDVQIDFTRQCLREMPDRDLCKVQFVARGQVIGRHNGREMRLRRGDFVLVDLTKQASWRLTSPHLVGMVFPKALLPLTADELRDLAGLRLSHDEGAGQLAGSLLLQAFSQTDISVHTEDLRFGGALIDLVSVVLAARVDRGRGVPEDVRQRALLTQIYAFIERNLGNLDLSPSTVAAANGVSVRYLHKLFEPQNETVAARIRRRRLECCRRDLADPALRGTAISAIAARWGLTNPTQFSRQFRLRYGMAPSDYRLYTQAMSS